jgi:predicted enzyme related to lactoylglutathione lyase
MPYKFSKCISLQTPQNKAAAEFYEKIFGFKVVDRQDNCVEIDASQNRVFIESGKHGGVVMELVVPDLEAARKELESNGCEVVTWNGKGKDNYIRDPFGFMFNLWEEPEAF